jgi:hypothetical protein
MSMFRNSSQTGNAGLHVVPLDPDLVQVMNTPAGFELQKVGTDFGRAMKLFGQVLADPIRAYHRQLVDYCKEYDAIVLSPFCLLLGYSVV